MGIPTCNEILAPLPLDEFPGTLFRTSRQGPQGISIEIDASTGQVKFVTLVGEPVVAVFVFDLLKIQT
jgi:hypothetical protein